MTNFLRKEISLRNISLCVCLSFLQVYTISVSRKRDHLSSPASERLTVHHQNNLNQTVMVTVL